MLLLWLCAENSTVCKRNWRPAPVKERWVMAIQMLADDIVKDFEQANTKKDAAQAFAWALRSLELDAPTWQQLAEVEREVE